MVSENILIDFLSLPINEQAKELLKYSKNLQKQILNSLNTSQIISLLHYLDIDDVTDIIQVLKGIKRKRILEQLSLEIRSKVKYLMRFDPKSAAGIMSMDYIEVDIDSSFKDVADAIKKHEVRRDEIIAILVVKDQFLIGELAIHQLILANPDENIAKYVKFVPSIRFDAKESDVFEVFKKYPHNKIVVLDKDNSIMGVIHSDDLLRIIRRKNTKSLYDFAGVNEEEDVFSGVFTKVKHRYKWLIINLATAFLAASVVGLFQNTISKFVVLAMYMPVIAGMGGNAATQTLAIAVRGIALNEISLKNSQKFIFNEVMNGVINGVINGLIVAFVAIIFNQSPKLGLVVSLAMISNLAIAGFFGAVVPLIMKKLNKDPATSATIFITTATDVCGFFLLLGLATMIL